MSEVTQDHIDAAAAAMDATKKDALRERWERLFATLDGNGGTWAPATMPNGLGGLQYYTGASFLDVVAIHAMQALVGRADMRATEDEKIAEDAYGLARAMLNQRNHNDR